VGTLRAHEGSVLHLHAVGTDLFSGGQDATIYCWSLESYRRKGVLKGHTAPVLSLTSLSSLLVSSSADLSIRTWDVQTLQAIQVFVGHGEPVVGVLCSDLFLLSASSDGLVKLWDVEMLQHTPLSSLSGAIGGGNDTLNALNLHPQEKSSDAYMIHLLRQFVSLESVSGSPAHSEGCWGAAKFLKSMLLQLGATQCSLVHCGPSTNPVVVGRIGDNPRQKTILICGH
jgi:WD40 repeat protein